MTTNLEASNKDSFVLVEFEYGDPLAPDLAHYTNCTKDIAFDGFTWASMPSLEVSPIEISSGLEERTCTVTLPVDAFTDPLSDGRPHSPVKVRIQELTDGIAGFEAITLLVGRLARTIRNPDGKPNLVRMELVTDKDHLRGAFFGIIMDVDCNNPFGGPGCYFDLSPYTVTRTVQTLGYLGDPKQLVLQSGLPMGPPGPGARYLRGYLEFEGLRILIRDQPLPYNSGVLRLVREPPASWAGVTLTVVPGCVKKLVEGCRAWGNEQGTGGRGGFNGVGFAIPAYHPVTEQN